MELRILARARRWAAGLLLACAAAAPAAAQEGPPAVPVEVTEVTVETVLDEVSAVGTLLSNESVVLRPEIAGLVTEIAFEEGANVQQGDLLFGLDDSIYRAELEDAEARLLLSQRNYERARDLYDRGAGTARSRDEAEAELPLISTTIGRPRATSPICAAKR